jgi:lysyl-tRNA synthetase class 1
LAKILPEKNQVDFVIKKLIEYGHLKKADEDVRKIVEERINFAKKWVQDFEKIEIVKEIELSGDMKSAIKDLINTIKKLDDGEEIQKEVFEIAKRFNIKPAEFFKTIYQILLKSNRGPRLGPYIIERGKEEVINKLSQVIK